MNRFLATPVFAIPASLSLLTLGISSALAQEDDIYELVTTAIHVRVSETALPVTVLDGDKLHDAVRATLGETLANQPGLNNASYGPAVGQTVIRGQQGRRVMNLSNGVPNADASGNSADHAQTVEAILANAIEVLRGPSTLLYGGGAIGGVVNVIDRRIASTLPAQPAFAVEARHDSAADLDTVVGSADFATGAVVWHFDAMQREWNDLDIPGFAIDSRYLEDDHDDEHEEDEHEEEEHDEDGMENTEGFVANSGGKTTTGTVGASWVFDNGFLGLAVNHLDNRYGLPVGSHAHGGHEDEHDEHDEHEDEDHDEHGEENVFIDMERTRYDLAGEWRNLAPWAEKLTYRLSYTDYEHAEMEGPGVVGTRYSNESLQHRLQLTHAEMNGFHGVFGLQHSSEEFGARGLESFIPVSDIDSTGIFVVEDYHAGSVTWEFGGRLNIDDYSPHNGVAPSRDFTTSSLSASALWDYSQPVSFGLSLSRSQRAPSIEELYSNFGLGDLDDCVIHFATGACEIGSVDFGRETSRNVDLTMYLDYGMLTATITGYHNDFADYIGLITSAEEADGFAVRYYRQDDARFSGIEVDVNLQFNDLVGLRLFGDTINGSFASNGDVPRLPPNRIGMELMLSGNQWSAFAQVLRAGAQDQPGAFELGTDGWTRFDIGADYTFAMAGGGELMLFAKGRNLGDEEIRLSASFLRGFAPEAGRSVEAGLRYRF
jgi:iron complex outermembrane receptor protein